MVKWVDSAEPADNADIEPADFPKPQTLTNIGYLVKEHSDYVVVAGAIKPDPAGTTYDYVIAIPRQSVVFVSDLRVDKKADGVGSSV